MTHYQHILLITDFSTHSQRAAVEAKSLQQQHGADLKVLHIAPVPSHYSIGFLDYEEIQERLTNEAKQQAQSYLVETQLSEDNLIIGVGEAEEQIAKTIREHHIDLIVLGTHSHGGRMGPKVMSAADDLHVDALMVAPA